MSGCSLIQTTQRVSEWRNTFGNKAISIVSSWFEDNERFPTIDDVVAYIDYLLGKDSPWLWKNGLEPLSEGQVRILCLFLFQG
jgi:hypothetical protein